MTRHAQDIDPVFPWVDELLWSWGSWVRSDRLPGVSGSALGRLHKQRMKELRIWVDDAPTSVAMEDGVMLLVDALVGRLAGQMRRIVKARYLSALPLELIALREHLTCESVRGVLQQAQRELAHALEDSRHGG